MPNKQNIANSNSGELLLYHDPDGKIKIDVHLEEETVWLTQKAIAQLFGGLND